MKKEILFNYGVNTNVESFYQEYTYNGLLEGFPLRILNEQKLVYNEERAREILKENSVVTIPPKITKIETDSFKNHFPEELPQVTCFLLLKSYQTFRDLHKDCSCLAIVFYQDEFVFPIQDDILKKIIEIDFKNLCSEYDL